MAAQKLILGTVQFGLSYGINNSAGKPTRETIFRLLDLAADAGIPALDSAGLYGDAESIIGAYFEKAGPRFRVNSKFKAEGDGPIETQLARTLADLHTARLGVYFYHRFGEITSVPGSLDALQKLKEAGQIESIGVSVYTNEELAAAVAIPAVDAIQLPFNLLDNASRRGTLLREAKEKGKEVQVRSVFLQGLFFSEPDTLSPYFAPLLPQLEQLRRLSRAHNISMFDMALGYALAQPEIDYAVIGVDNERQLQQNLCAATVSLPDSLISEIDALQVSDESLLFPYNWS